MNRLLKLIKFSILGFVALIIIIIFIGVHYGSDKTNQVSKTTSTVDASELKSNWKYTEEEDKIHNAKIKLAQTTSINTLNFKFPYSGQQHSHIFIRKNSDGSKDAMIVIEKGQLLVSVLGGKALVRFDDEVAEEFQLVAPADHSTTKAFVKYSDVFIKKIMKSKNVYIQTDIYQEGNPTMEFNVEGLNTL